MNYIITKLHSERNLPKGSAALQKQLKTIGSSQEILTYRKQSDFKVYTENI